MEYTIKKKYLVFPVSEHAAKKNIRFFRDGVCVYDLDLRLDYVSKTDDVYIDMGRFFENTLDISVFPEMKLVIKERDRKPLCRFNEAMRPKYHFTSPEGWINDPNGLVYAGGKYHLFYQLNPCGKEWGNMHWGHAESSNLVDWEHLPIALFPDESGAMFSGGGIVDEKNVTGMQNCEKKPIVLYYTAAGGKSFASRGKPSVQCMATSLDGGKSFLKYELNPIIPHIAAENRDPKVVYSEKLGLFVMSLYLEADEYAIFVSKNLTQWRETQRVTLPNDNECPAFFPIENSDGVEKWVLMGAHDRYVVGNFDGEKFVPEHDGSLMFNFTGNNVYASQKFENAGKRCLRFGWITARNTDVNLPFNGAMTVPQELTLVSGSDGDRLFVNPAAEVEKLHRGKVKKTQTADNFALKLAGAQQDIMLTLTANGAESATVSVFGTVFELNFNDGLMFCEKYTLPLLGKDGIFKIRLLTDCCGTEVYLSDGAAFGMFMGIPDANLCTLEIKAQKPLGIKVEAFKMRNAKFTDKRK